MNRFFALWLAAAAAAPSALAHEAEDSASATATQETVVTARKAPVSASATSFHSEDFEARPLRDASDILETSPGLLTVQHAGGGKANQYFLRGFDLDHGTDIALFSDGVPVNMVSHGHGQGYADLHFLIPELVDRLDVRKGPYAAEDGDFATAGAADFWSKHQLSKNQTQFTAGNFGLFRGLALLSPVRDFPGYFGLEGAAENGPFALPEKMRRLNGVGHLELDLGRNVELGLHAQAYGSRWNASGQIPLRAVEAGELGRFDSVDLTDGGDSQRHSLSASLHRATADARWRISAYALRYVLDLYSNFTFFAADPVAKDQIEQTDRRWVYGGTASYLRVFTFDNLLFRTQVGFRLRHDVITNGLFHTERRARLSPTAVTHITETNAGAFLEEDIGWTPWLRTVLSLRADGFRFHTEDVLQGNLAATKNTFLASPKASVVVSPFSKLDVYSNYGRGFHSNDARGVTKPVDAVTPVTAATGYEVGLQARPVHGLELTLAAWALNLDSELVWVGDEGTTEAKGASRRRGWEAEARYQVAPWLALDASVTFTRARLVDTGMGQQYVPLAPKWTFSTGAYAEHPSGLFASVRLMSLSDRPAIEDNSFVAEGFALLDAEIGYRHKRYQMSLEGRNLLDQDWRQAQFANTSRLSNEPAPVDDLHFTPGYPFSFSATAALFF